MERKEYQNKMESDFYKFMFDESKGISWMKYTILRRAIHFGEKGYVRDGDEKDGYGKNPYSKEDLIKICGEIEIEGKGMEELGEIHKRYLGY